MKLILFSAVLLMLLFTGTAKPDECNDEYEQYLFPCETNADCSLNECCRQSKCSTKFFCMKKLKRGSKCFLSTNEATAERFTMLCPCEDNTKCSFHAVPKGKLSEVFPWGFAPICVDSTYAHYTTNSVKEEFREAIELWWKSIVTHSNQAAASNAEAVASSTS